MVLDDNPDLSPRQILAFEHACRDLLDVEQCLVYRDWLEENGCKRRVARMNNSLAAEAAMLERLATVVEKKDRTDDDPEAKAWLDNRILMLHQALQGREESADNGIDGIGVLYFPNEEYIGTNGQTILARDRAIEIANNIRPGGVIAIPSAVHEDGHRLWDFKIEGGHPGQVRVEATQAEGS